jgi:hypothetical protein
MLNDNQLSFKLLESQFLNCKFFHKEIYSVQTLPHYISFMFNDSGWWIWITIFFKCISFTTKSIPQVTDSAAMFLSKLSLSDRHTHTNVYTLCSRYSCNLQSPQFEYWQFVFHLPYTILH